MEKLLRIKTPQWRRGGVLEEQVSLMEDMSSYFKKWREWRNGDLDNKSSTSIKRADNDGIGNKKQPINQNQSINNSINRLNVNLQILAFQQAFSNFNKLLKILALYFLTLAKFLANFQQCYFIKL